MTAVAREVSAVGSRLCLSPVADVARDPRWGRFEETFGAVDVCIDMCIHMCTGLSVDMCVDMCIDMCVDMYMDVCGEMCRRVC